MPANDNSETEDRAGDVPATGIVGLGDIGRGVAGTLVAAGVDLTVCDVRAEAAEPFRRAPGSQPPRPRSPPSATWSWSRWSTTPRCGR